MNLNTFNRRAPLMALLLVLVALPALGQDTQADNEYSDGDYARVSDARDGVKVLRSSWQEQTDVTDDASLNSPIFPGDEVITDFDQRVEVQLAGGSLVWIDDRSKLEFAALPNPYSDVPDNAVLKLSEGSLRMSAVIEDDADFRIDTPAASVYPLDNAEFRVDVGPSGRTTISSHRGVIEVAANGGSVLVRSGTRSIVSPGSLPSSPEPFHSFASDGLDRYADARDDLYRESESLAEGDDAYQELPAEVRPYYRELSANGRWSYVDDYGYVWQPVGVAADWRPYSAGYWGYGPRGYFWISNEPWGWAPYHYGRWSYISGHGWGWTAGSVFGGAWVSWSWGSAHVGWGPLDYWDYPAYRSVYHHGYYDPFCWTFVNYNHFYSRNYYHHRASWGHVQHSVHRSAVVTRPPRVSPRRLASSASARQSAVDHSKASRSRIARRDSTRTSDPSFLSNERRLNRPERSTQRSRVSAPDGRSRQQPNLRSSERRLNRPERSTPRSRVSAPDGRSRQQPNLRSSERRLNRPERSTQRSRVSAPDGRSRQQSNLRSSERRSSRAESSERARDARERERLPVSSRQKQLKAVTPDAGQRRPAAQRNRSGSAGEGVKSVSPRSRGEAASSRVDGRMRDLFRKVSKPRQTKETPSSGRSTVRRGSVRKPVTSSTPRVTKPQTRSKSGASGRREPSASRGDRPRSVTPKKVNSPKPPRGGVQKSSGNKTKRVSRSGGNAGSKSGSRRGRSAGSRSGSGRRR